MTHLHISPYLMCQASVTAPLTITTSLKQLEADVAGLGNKWHGKPKAPLD